jgi:hypothetical protein
MVVMWRIGENSFKYLVFWIVCYAFGFFAKKQKQP